MATYQITCIVKPGDNQSAHEHITHVGGLEGGGWIEPVATTISDIDSGANTYYVKDEFGNRSSVGVVRPTDGRRVHIRTYADGKWNNNLLSLGDCRR